MKRKMSVIGNKDKKMAVISPSLLCNYNCPYCRIKTKEKSKHEHELKEWAEALKKIGAPVVHISGGEPTVLDGFEDFVVNYTSPIRMTTNLWRDPYKWGKGFWEKFEYMTLSFHPSHTSFEEFSRKVVSLNKIYSEQESRPEIACTIVAYPEYLDRFRDWIDRLIAIGVNARGQYYNSGANDSTKTYTEKELRKLKDMDIPMSSNIAGQEVYSEKTLKECNAGMFYAFIDTRGNAKRCSRDSLKLGNIFDGSFEWFESEKECISFCTEACDLTFTKHRVVRVINNKEEASHEIE